MNSCKVNSRLLSQLTTLLRHAQRHFSVPATKENEFSGLNYLNVVKNDESKLKEVIKYPPILDKSLVGVLQRKREGWYNKVKRLGIVEEKIFEINMPKYYGWKVNKIQEGTLPYDPLPQAQYITRTALAGTNVLPDYYNNILNEETLDYYVKKIKSQVEDALVFEYYYRNRNHEYQSFELEDKKFMDDVMAKAVSQQIHRILISNLTPEYGYLLEAQTDIEPRIEAFWFFGGLERPYEYRRFEKQDVTDPLNEGMKYIGTPILQLRHNLPLKEIVSLSDSENDELEVPVEPLDLRKTGYMKSRERATIIPGFWPGDHNEFGVLSYHNIGYIEHRPEEYEDHTDAITAQAIFGSFGWLYTQACYQGFSTFQDPTYPLVNQMILTNGQSWRFFVYQLNTTAMHIDSINTNPRKNICWNTELIKLFDSIENEKVIGFNEDVLKYLIKFYINQPMSKEGVDMKPYLKKEKLIANIEDPERRIWVENNYKFLMSNRERHFLTPEIHHFQDIYIHKHQKILNRNQRNIWQRKISPFSRRLDDHTPKYIPKCLRPAKFPKVKYAKTFYPTVRKRKPVLKVRRYKLC